MLSRLPLDPGRYEIRAAVSGDDGRTGSVFTYLEVPEFAKAPLSVSAIAIDAAPRTLAAPGKAFAGLIPIVPTTRREFAGTDAIAAFVRLYQGGSDRGTDRLGTVQVSATVQDARGRTVVEERESLGPDRFDARRAADYRIDLPAGTLEPGEYLLRIEATREKRSVGQDVRVLIK